MPKLAVILPPSLPIPASKGGSIQTVVYDVLKNLTEFEIYTFSKRQKDQDAQYTDAHGIKHFYIDDHWYDNLEIARGNDFLLRYNRYIYKVANRLKEIGPDIVHVHNRPHFIPIVRKVLGPKAKIVLSEHNAKIAESKYIQKKIKKIMSSLDRVVYCSKYLLEQDLTELYPEYAAKGSFIHNSVDLDLFKPKSSYDVPKLKSKYKVGGKKVILFVGRLVKEKGADVLLEAFRPLSRTEKDVVLMIVGSAFFQGAAKTAYVKKLEMAAKELQGKVIFTGFVEQKDMPELYALADVFVAPVRWEEPLSKVNHEAGAVGTPVITVNIGGIPEVVINNETGLLLDKDFSAVDLQKAIKKVMTDPDLGLKLSTRARSRIAESFSAKKTAEQWLEFYRGCLS